MENRGTRLKTILLAAILVIASGFLLFHNLGLKPFRIWDESRMAANSIEMYRGGFSFIPTYEGKTDMWNTKPPVLIWLQTASLHLFGISEWSIRLPSALSGAGLTLLLFFFIRRVTGNGWIAALAAMVPVTSEGFLLWHGCRSGEYDALLSLLVTGYAVSFFLFTQYHKTGYLYLTFVLITLAVMTKSTAALFMLPGMAIWAMLERQATGLLRSTHFWLGLLMFLMVAGVYYMGRELAEPGYLRAVDQNEVTGRFMEVSEGNRGNFFFYVKGLFNDRFNGWIWLFLATIPLSLLHPEKKTRKVGLFAIVSWLSFLLLISAAKTKLNWYDIPAYPFFAITMAVGCHGFFIRIRKTLPRRTLLIAARITGTLLLLAFLVQSYVAMAIRVDKLEESPWDEELYHIQYLLRDAISGKLELSGYSILFDPAAPQFHQRAKFYLHHLDILGKPVPQIIEGEIESGAELIIYDPQQFKRVSESWELRVNEEVPWESVKLIRVERKHPPGTMML